MTRTVDRRSLLKGTAGAAAGMAAMGASKRSTAFAAPNVVKQTGSTVDITYWGSFSDALGDAEQAVVDAFNASQSDVRVTRQFQGTYEETAQKLTAALVGGGVPDVSLLSDVNWFRFYLAQALLPMNDLMSATDYDTTDIVDSLLIEGIRQGQQYWLPFARSTPLFYYNREMFAAAGLEGPPATWSEFAEVAPSLVDEGSQRSAFAHPNGASYIAWLFQGVAWAFGGSYSDPDFTIRMTEPETVAAGEFYRRSVAEGWATTPDDIVVDFVSGLTASMMASTGGLAGITANADFDFGTAFLPEEIAFGCCTGGAGMAILAGIPAERQEAAFQFIQYCTSTDVTTQWSQSTGYMPVRKSAQRSESMQRFFAENPNFQTAVDQLSQTRPQDAARVFIPGGDQIIGAGLEQVTINGQDPASAFEAVAAELAEAAAPVVERLQELGDTGDATPAATP
jgi:sn-glycerol 3-phosphate transport system substrate-binding protein